jgi:hypothetical protein
MRPFARSPRRPILVVSRSLVASSRVVPVSIRLAFELLGLEPLIACFLRVFVWLTRIPMFAAGAPITSARIASRLVAPRGCISAISPIIATIPAAASLFRR